jgi:hypothetical protein
MHEDGALQWRRLGSKSDAWRRSDAFKAQLSVGCGRDWFTILRLYSPLPSFFDKSWRSSEIGKVESVQ